MSDNSIEKPLLYLVACSILLHVAVFSLILLLPEQKKTPPKEPLMVELRDLPATPPAPPAREKDAKRIDETRRRVERETAPRGDRERDRLVPVPRPQPTVPPAPQPPSSPVRPGPSVPQRETPRPADRGDTIVRRDQQRESTGRDVPRLRRERVPDLAKLLPNADKMAKLEESYRKKYGPEVEEGETKFLNTEDILFGSFLRRFETAVYGVWRYPAEAVRMGIEGTTPVRITFNRAGEIVNIQVLETSGSRILDEEVVRTLRQIGPIGSFPRNYQKETFNLIAFFQYGLTSGTRHLH